MDRDPNGAWWVVGGLCGLLFLAGMALVDQQDQMIEQKLIINNLRTEAAAVKSRERAWACSRPSEDAKRGGLVRWCLTKSGV